MCVELLWKHLQFSWLILCRLAYPQVANSLHLRAITRKEKISNTHINLPLMLYLL